MSDEMPAGGVEFLEKGGYRKYPNTTQKGGLPKTGTYHRDKSPDVFVWSIGKVYYWRVAASDAAADAAASHPTATVASAGGGPTALPAAVYNPLGLSAAQLQAVTAVITVGIQKKAPSRALLAACLIGVAENGWDAYTCNKSDHCGVFQLDPDWQRMHSYSDTAWWAAYAYDNGFYGYGGLIHIANTHTDWSIGEIVQACQGAGPTWQAAVDYYNGRLSEANAIFNTYGLHIAGGKSIGGPNLGSPPSAAGPSSPNVTIGQIFKSLNWAGDFELLWQHVQGGANEAANMADKNLAKVLQTKYVKPSG